MIVLSEKVLDCIFENLARDNYDKESFYTARLVCKTWNEASIRVSKKNIIQLQDRLIKQSIHEFHQLLNAIDSCNNIFFKKILTIFNKKEKTIDFFNSLKNYSEDEPIDAKVFSNINTLFERAIAPKYLDLRLYNSIKHDINISSKLSIKNIKTAKDTDLEEVTIINEEFLNDLLKIKSILKKMINGLQSINKIQFPQNRIMILQTSTSLRESSHLCTQAIENMIDLIDEDLKETKAFFMDRIFNFLIDRLNVSQAMELTNKLPFAFQVDVQRKIYPTLRERFLIRGTGQYFEYSINGVVELIKRTMNDPVFRMTKIFEFSFQKAETFCYRQNFAKCITTLEELKLDLEKERNQINDEERKKLKRIMKACCPFGIYTFDQRIEFLKNKVIKALSLK